jgi:hypothetical protein
MTALERHPGDSQEWLTWQQIADELGIALSTLYAQGLPPVVTDPATLERVAAVLRLVALPEPAPFSSRTHRRPAERRHGHG